MYSYALITAVLLCWCLQVSHSEPVSGGEATWTWLGVGWYDNIKQELMVRLLFAHFNLCELS